MRSATKTARAFTLVELLVVIGIISLLMGIMMPTLAKVRQAGNRTACRAALKDIGARLNMYLNDSRTRLPWVNTMPSIRPVLNAAPSIVDLLQPYTKGAEASYQCHADRITQPSPGSPDGFQTYFSREGSSYQYSPFLATIWAGHSVTDKRVYGRREDPTKAVFVSDYEAFHGSIGSNEAMNVLYMDGHVADLAQ